MADVKQESSRIILEIRKIISITNQILSLCFQRPPHLESIQIPFEFDVFF